MKNGTIVLPIPSQYIKSGRRFAILALDQNETGHTILDSDASNSTISVDISVAGYAFDLIYTDMA